MQKGTKKLRHSCWINASLLGSKRRQSLNLFHENKVQLQSSFEVVSMNGQKNSETVRGCQGVRP